MILTESMDKNEKSNDKSVIHGDELQGRVALLAVIVIAFAVRLWHINWGLPELYEEAVPYKISLRFWNWGYSGFDFNPHFFVYPAFTFYLQFAAEAVQYLAGHLAGMYANPAAFYAAYSANPSTLIITARLIMVVFDLGSVITVYYLGCRFADRKAALLAAILVAINPLHVGQAHLINVDTPLTFFVLLSVFFLSKVYTESSLKWYLFAGMSIGLATATKYNGALLIFVFILIHLLKSSSVKHALRSLKSLHLIAGLVVCMIVFAAVNPFIILDFRNFFSDFSGVERHMEVGHLGLDTNTNTGQYYFFETLPRILGWPLLLLAVMYSVYFLINRRKGALVLLAFPIVYLCTIGSWMMRADRYIFPTIPFFMIIGSIGLFELLNGIIKHLSRNKNANRTMPRIYSAAAAILIGIVFIYPQAFDAFSYHRSISKRDTRTITKDWIYKHLPLGSAIATGPFGIELSDNQYLLLLMPFDALNPESNIPFYDTQWYEDFDLLITSDYDYGRYKQEPDRYYNFLQFYDSLRATWKLNFQIIPGDSLSGPTFWLYSPIIPSRMNLSFDWLEAFRVITDTSKTVNFLGRLGRILQSKGKLEKSEQLFREAIRTDPRNFLAYKNLASIQYELQHNEEGLANTQRGLALKPDNAELTALEGSTLLRLNRLEESEAALTKALELDRGIESAYLDLSIIYAARNEKQKIIETLTRYLSILPQNSSKADIIKRRIAQLTDRLEPSRQ